MNTSRLNFGAAPFCTMENTQYTTIRFDAFARSMHLLLRLHGYVEDAKIFASNDYSLTKIYHAQWGIFMTKVKELSLPGTFFSR